MSESICGKSDLYNQDALRLEAVTVSVGFDDLLDFTLGLNHSHFDSYIVVTSHDDKETPKVCAKHGAFCVPTDLFMKNGRLMNKGAAINAGYGYFQWWGWRLNLDADILLPDKFRQTLFNHTHLERSCLYGADRCDVIGKANIEKLVASRNDRPQHRHHFFIDQTHGGQVDTSPAARINHTLHGYTPIGFFQLWHASCQKTHPYSLGTAAHDDTLFAQLWPLANRRLLPSVICYHICPAAPKWSQNWEGQRKMPRLK